MKHLAQKICPAKIMPFWQFVAIKITVLTKSVSK